MTVNELRAALDKLVAERPECGEMPAVYDACVEIKSVEPRGPGKGAVVNLSDEPEP